jgi:hypothetical protein
VASMGYNGVVALDVIDTKFRWNGKAAIKS